MNRLWVLCVIPLLALGCVLTAEPPSLLENPPQTASVRQDFAAGEVLATVPQPTSAPEIVTVTAEEALNLRISYGVHARIITTLPAGAKLFVVGDCQYDDGWWVNVITTDRVGGWVNVEFISGDVCK